MSTPTPIRPNLKTRSFARCKRPQTPHWWRGDTHSVSAWFGAGFGQHGSRIEKMGGCPESKTTLNGSAWSSNAIDQSRCGRMRCEKKGAIRRRMMSMGRLVGKPGPSGAKCVPGSAMSPRDRLCLASTHLAPRTDPRKSGKSGPRLQPHHVRTTNSGWTNCGGDCLHFGGRKFRLWLRKTPGAVASPI